MSHQIPQLVDYMKLAYVIVKYEQIEAEFINPGLF
jgi:hypothetical protein